MKRRIAVLALDGRHDLAAIDWHEEESVSVRVLQGGTMSDVITTLIPAIPAARVFDSRRIPLGLVL